MQRNTSKNISGQRKDFLAKTIPKSAKQAKVKTRVGY